MAETIIPIYLMGAIGSDRENEPALQAIKQAVEKSGGEIVDPHVSNWDMAMMMRETLGWKGLKEFDWVKMNYAVAGIAEVSAPSIGVGRELQRLLDQEKPILAVRNATSLYKSALVDGEDSPLFRLEEYRDLKELTDQVALFVEEIKLEIQAGMMPGATEIARFLRHGIDKE